MKLDILNLKELLSLNAEIQRLIPIKREEARRALLEDASKLAADHGFGLADVLGTARPRLKIERQPMRDAKTGVVWRGGGRYPKGFSKARAVPT